MALHENRFFVPDVYHVNKQLKKKKGLFYSPQTLNGHVKKGTGSLIRLPGVTTGKWSQIGAALTFLMHTPSLILARIVACRISPSSLTYPYFILHTSLLKDLTDISHSVYRSHRFTHCIYSDDLEPPVYSDPLCVGTFI